MKVKLWGNWGLWLTVFIVLFIIGNIVVLVVISSERFDLVEENYYENELKYQEKIDKISRTQKLKEQIAISKNDDKLIINYPDDFSGKTVEGKIFFYRPSDKRLDFVRTIKINKYNKQEIKDNNIARGVWVIKVDLEVDGKGYYSEQEIIL